MEQLRHVEAGDGAETTWRRLATFRSIKPNVAIPIDRCGPAVDAQGLVNKTNSPATTRSQTP